MSGAARTPTTRWREAALAGVLVCGLVQTVLVYADVGGPPTPEPLSAAAARGLALWRTHNCQACHQVYGFGGFLGPDLTNVLDRYAPDELDQVLEFGRNQMPAFGFTRAARRDLVALFDYWNRSGQSQPDGLRDRRPVPPREHFERLAAAVAERTGKPLPASVRRGAAVTTEMSCGDCHRPLTTGRFLAPDWTVRRPLRTRAELRAVIRDGRNVMPGFALSDTDTDALLDLIDWMSANREILVTVNDTLCDREPFRFSEVPWFAYR